MNENVFIMLGVSFLAGGIVALAGVMLGAWIYYRARNAQSPAVPMPSRKIVTPKPEKTPEHKPLRA